jgi:acetyltransferase-like isoleucine patch superfamily enzyme
MQPTLTLAHVKARLTRPWPVREYVGMLQKMRGVALARLYLRGCKLGRLVRVVGRPVLRRYGGGEIVLGDRVQIVSRITRCELGAGPGARLEIGARTTLNDGCSIAALQSVRIGERCRLGTYVNIIDNNFHDIYDRDRTPPSRPVVIEENVWLASRVTVLPGAHIGRNAVLGVGSIVAAGVRIGHDAIVAAGSVVHENLPPRSVAMGNPAKVIYTLPEPSVGAATGSVITDAPAPSHLSPASGQGSVAPQAPGQGD